MSYSHILDEIFAERNDRFEKYGIHEKREQWNAYNELLRTAVEECLEQIKSSPTNTKEFQAWADLSDPRKKKLILDIYKMEEDDQEETNGMYYPGKLRLGIKSELQCHLVSLSSSFVSNPFYNKSCQKFAAKRRNDTTRTGEPLVDYTFADSQKDFDRWLKKFSKKLKGKAKPKTDISSLEAQTAAN
ncbi:hypothetical protein JR316_0000243 [Psilocybe cubensis]|uniref:Uncharacterized protein n=1 Tax=Psilocybe cubensis TaxID=181762 RepID=A0ACB8HEQ5_PSICU|nr:hypothetical protein JR316_0000243 [Psilocybe cubensis]KAH9486179.1 hypothetical protein JR316_0000243 [Psilocybe cubensis]